MFSIPSPLFLLCLLLCLSSSVLSFPSSSLSSSSSPSLCVPPYPTIALGTPSVASTIALGVLPAFSGTAYSVNTTVLAGQPYALSFQLSYLSIGHPVSAGTCSCAYSFASLPSQSCGSLTSVVPPSPQGSVTESFVVSYPTNDTSVEGVAFSLIFTCSWAYNQQNGQQGWSLSQLALQMSSPPSVYNIRGLPNCTTTVVSAALPVTFSSTGAMSSGMSPPPSVTSSAFFNSRGRQHRSGCRCLIHGVWCTMGWVTSM